MLKNERQEHILRLLQEKKFCTVNELSRTLYVSPMTVRRDLSILEEQEKIVRSHGGASIPQHINRTVPLEIRENINLSVKSQLARRAAAQIRMGDTIFLDASSTTLQIVDYLHPDQKLTVITNSLRAMDKLQQRHIRSYCTGGGLIDNSYGLAGPIAENTIRGLYADLMFFSSQGITEDGEITDFSESETALRRIMLHRAKRAIYLFDESKLGQKYLFHICHVEQLDQVITNADIRFDHPSPL